MTPSQRLRKNRGTRTTSVAGDVTKSFMGKVTLKKTSKSIALTATMICLPMCAVYVTSRYLLGRLRLRKITSPGMETVIVAPAVTRN